MLMVESVISNTAVPEDSEGDAVVMGWQERRTTRHRARTKKGRELAIALPTGTVLLDGDLLWLGRGFHVRVEAEEEDVLILPLGDAASAARLAYELGNRHLPVSISSDGIMTPYDRLVEDLLARSGVPWERRSDKFEPAGGTHHHG